MKIEWVASEANERWHVAELNGIEATIEPIDKVDGGGFHWVVLPSNMRSEERELFTANTAKTLAGAQRAAAAALKKADAHYPAHSPVAIDLGAVESGATKTRAGRTRRAAQAPDSAKIDATAATIEEERAAAKRTSRVAKNSERAAKKSATKSAPAKKATKSGYVPVLPDATEKKRPRGGFVVEQRAKSRQTGTTVQTLDLAHPDSTIELGNGSRWATRCVEHNVVVRHDTHRIAVYAARKPASFCKKCASQLAKNGATKTSAPAKSATKSATKSAPAKKSAPVVVESARKSTRRTQTTKRVK